VNGKDRRMICLRLFSHVHGSPWVCLDSMTSAGAGG
jgi:hypothetical protein